MASIGGAGTFDGIFLIGIVAVLIASLSQSMEQKLTSDARPIPDHVVDGLVRFDAGLLTEEDRREMIRRIQLDLLRACRERPRRCRAADERDELAPPSSSARTI